MLAKPSILASAVLAFSACSDSIPASDRAELAAMSPVLVVPKTSPKSFVRTFDRFCVNQDRDFASMNSALRNASYVKAGTRGNLHHYVVNDNRPSLSFTPQHCFITAKSRTGQTQAVRNYVAKTFANATQLTGKRLPKNAEEGWVVDSPQPALILTTRHAAGARLTEYTLHIMQLDGL